MGTALAWQDMLSQAEAGHHIAQVYQDVGFLSEAVGLYAATGLRGGEGVVVIASKPHWHSFVKSLEAYGLQPQEAESRGQLLFLDAEETLAKFMVNGSPDPALFSGLISGVLDQMGARYPVIRAYGEMVDVLWQSGNLDAAVRLEELWNQLSELRDFSLFCAYLLDNLDDGAYQGALQSICKTHTHLIPAKDYGEFEKAVDQAVDETLGTSLVGMLQALLANHRPGAVMPSGQATLLWMKDNMPYTATRILTRMRSGLRTRSAASPSGFSQDQDLGIISPQDM
jgi:hypothetical protein